MATTDQQVLSELQYAMIEPTVDNGVTWTSALWTATEVLELLNQRQYRFMKDTLLMLAYARVNIAANVSAGALPSDWIVTARADWKDGTTGTVSELPRSSTQEIDLALPDWAAASADRPQLYDDAESASLIFKILPAASVDGQVLLLYVSLTALLDGAGELFTVPDEFVPAIKYGVLADMLRKVGRAHDPDRADYCESRYQEGVEIAKIMLDGWGAIEGM